MLEGIQLSLYIGPALPLPAPRKVVDALTRVEVTVKSDDVSGFQLFFSVDKNSSINTLFLFSGGSPIPLIRVMLVVTLQGTPEVLIDGVVTNTELQPGNDGGNSTLVITGEDLSRVMDYFDFSGIPYPMPDFVKVATIIAKYSPLGIVPAPVPAILTDFPIPTNEIPAQEGTDLYYILGLARKNGHVFYVESGPAPGLNIAYWGPEIKVGIPQPALSINMDAHTNVESLSFNFNSEYKTTPVVYVNEPVTKMPIPIPIPDISPLNPPLGLVQPIAKKVEQLGEAAKENPVRAAMFGLKKAAETSDAITADGSLSVLRYGRILKARRLVGVRGAGHAFDGLYFVTSVKSTIERGTFNQRFTLSRNGLISITQKIPV